MNIVTGSFGYTGKYITRRLLAMGQKVRTITGHPNRPNPFGDQITVAPFNFDNHKALVKSLQGATTLYNTYWIRFAYGEANFDETIKNTQLLINAAEEAGIQRIVHISITSALESSHLPYFKGKGLLEQAIIDSNLSYAIIRPTVIFGPEDILINNIAWFLRRFPVFAIPGSGSYRLQPIFVEDMAQLAINVANQKENIIIDAVGPEIYNFNELIQLIKDKLHSRTKIIHLKPGLAQFLSNIVGFIVKDVVLTQDEVEGLMANLLVSKNPPTGQMRLSDWLDKNSDSIGIKYASELNRHYR